LAAKTYLLLTLSTQKTMRTIKRAKETNPKIMEIIPKKFRKRVLEDTLYRM
jgi:hypothetical protein